MSQTIRVPVAAISPDPLRLEALQNQLALHSDWGVSIVFGSCDPDTFLANLHRHDPACFLIDLNLEPEQWQVLVESLQGAGFRAFVFLGNDPPPLDLPGEIVPPGAPTSSLVAAVLRAASQRSSGVRAAGGQGSGRPHIVTVHSPKGGTGKTLIACSLAAQYAAKGKRTLLLDLAVYGGVGPSLGVLRRDKTLTAVIEALEQAGSAADPPELGALIQSNLVRYPIRDRALNLLLAGQPLKMGGLTLGQTETLIRWLAAGPYDVIVIDTSGEIAERTAVALRRADAVLLVVTPDLPAAWSLVAMKDLLKNLSNTSLQVAINRSTPGLGRSELEQAIGYPIIAELPEVGRPWEQAVGSDLSLDYSTFGLMVKRLAHRFCPIYSAIELPHSKRQGGDP